jgi:hypothetical protein
MWRLLNGRFLCQRLAVAVPLLPVVESLTSFIFVVPVCVVKYADEQFHKLNAKHVAFVMPSDLDPFTQQFSHMIADPCLDKVLVHPIVFQRR